MSLSDIERPVDYLVELCDRHGVQKLVLFGSRARGITARAVTLT